MLKKIAYEPSGGQIVYYMKPKHALPVVLYCSIESQKTRCLLHFEATSYFMSVYNIHKYYLNFATLLIKCLLSVTKMSDIAFACL